MVVDSGCVGNDSTSATSGAEKNGGRKKNKTLFIKIRKTITKGHNIRTFVGCV